MTPARRPRRVAGAALVLAGLSAGARAQGADDLDGRLDALVAAHPGSVAAADYGTSREGRRLRVLTLGVEAVRDVPPPALLVVAGLDGRHRVGIETALALAEHLLADEARLAGVRVHVIPCANPDGLARFAGGAAVADFGGVLRPDDQDRDGRVDEDGPRDVDGDGAITWLRVADPPPDLPRTHLPDPDEPRLMRRADPVQGERATHALLIEGIDQDGDGAVGEDGRAGVDLDQNFPARWHEHSNDAGPYPLSEPETRALVEWMLERPDIACVLVYGPGDNLLNVPVGGQTDATKEAPEGLESGDRRYHEEVARLFKERTGMEQANAAATAGAFHRWCYAHFGVPAFTTPVYVPPAPAALAAPAGAETPPQQDAAAGAASDDAAGTKPAAGAPAGQGGKRGKGKEEDPLREERAWLGLCDRLGAGFQPWRPFAHPSLGALEIGGFVPGVRGNPPASELDDLVRRQAAFAGDLLERLPRLTLAAPRVERLGASAWRVRVAVVNDGWLPTTTELGVKLRRLTPWVFRIEVDDDALLGGARLQSTWSIPGSGGEAAAEWLVAGAAGASVPLTIRGATLAPVTLAVPLDAPEEGR